MPRAALPLSTQLSAPRAGGRRVPGAIDWEDMPSLAHLLVQVDATVRTESVWSETVPASLDALLPSDPFHESLPGLEIREVNEPDIFRIFFGGAASGA